MYLETQNGRDAGSNLNESHNFIYLVIHQCRQNNLPVVVIDRGEELSSSNDRSILFHCHIIFLLSVTTQKQQKALWFCALLSPLDSAILEALLHFLSIFQKEIHDYSKYIHVILNPKIKKNISVMEFCALLLQHCLFLQYLSQVYMWESKQARLQVT